MKKIIILVFSFFILFACNEKPQKEEPTVQIENTSSQLSSKLTEQEDVKFTIISLSKKKDSLLKVLESTKESMSRINESKIDKGIEGVNVKLDELKGQKENFEEQVSLQKQEMGLAAKKIELLNEEKKVYDQQKKALWDKGAPPKDFVGVDSLLNGLTGKITEQTKRVKFLNRNIADIEEQVLSINEQRTFLSTKIRENYNAQEIFTEFASEEKEKIKLQIDAIDKQISALNGDVNALNSTIAGLDETVKNATVHQDKQKANSNRLKLALIFVGIVIIIFVFLYWLGKKRKRNLKK